MGLFRIRQILTILDLGHFFQLIGLTVKFLQDPSFQMDFLLFILFQIGFEPDFLFPHFGKIGLDFADFLVFSRHQIFTVQQNLCRLFPVFDRAFDQMVQIPSFFHDLAGPGLKGFYFFFGDLPAFIQGFDMNFHIVNPKLPGREFRRDLIQSIAPGVGPGNKAVMIEPRLGKFFTLVFNL